MMENKVQRGLIGFESTSSRNSQDGQKSENHVFLHASRNTKKKGKSVRFNLELSVILVGKDVCRDKSDTFITSGLLEHFASTLCDIYWECGAAMCLPGEPGCRFLITVQQFFI